MNKRFEKARVSARCLVASVLLLLSLGLAVSGALAGAAGRGMRGPNRGMPRMGGPPTVMDRVWEPKRSYRSPFDLAFAPEGGTLVVSDRTGGRLYVVDAQAGQDF